MTNDNIVQCNAMPANGHEMFSRFLKTYFLRSIYGVIKIDNSGPILRKIKKKIDLVIS